MKLSDELRETLSHGTSRADAHASEDVVSVSADDWRKIIRSALRAADLLDEAERALAFYADERLDGYDVHVTDYGLSTEEGVIIKDGGDTARATLTKLRGQA